MSAPMLSGAVADRLAAFERERTIERIWAKDPSVWSDDPTVGEISNRLGWLDVAGTMPQHLPTLERFAGDVRGTFDRVVLLGMGGSSLAPEVLWRSLGRRRDSPAFRMLDSTHPAAVLAIEETGRLDRTLFIVASKSGTTIETRALFDYFWSRAGSDGNRFVAITDPETPLAALAAERGFRETFLNPGDIGGRFSALLLFALAPAAAMGLDVSDMLQRAETMIGMCAGHVAPDENPGARLGAWLGEAALGGCDKLTLRLTESVRSFGLWAEQLIAESTGKRGRGLLPVIETTRVDVAKYGKDRSFVAIGPAGANEVDSTTQSGPTTAVTYEDVHDMPAEFFRWEFATAVCGAVLGVNPFDQPNVAESKRNTARVLEGGAGTELPRPARRHDIVEFVDAIDPGDYLAVTAWLCPSPGTDARLAELQRILIERTGVAVTVGYGPRFLHSTGQFHKGGPQVGHFIQLIDPTPPVVDVPGAAYTFGELLSAQAVGDYEALRARGRPVLRLTELDHLLETI